MRFSGNGGECLTEICIGGSDAAACSYATAKRLKLSTAVQQASTCNSVNVLRGYKTSGVVLAKRIVSVLVPTRVSTKVQQVFTRITEYTRLNRLSFVTILHRTELFSSVETLLSSTSSKTWLLHGFVETAGVSNWLDSTILPTGCSTSQVFAWQPILDPLQDALPVGLVETMRGCETVLIVTGELMSTNSAFIVFEELFAQIQPQKIIVFVSQTNVPRSGAQDGCPICEYLHTAMPRTMHPALVPAEDDASPQTTAVDLLTEKLARFCRVPLPNVARNACSLMEKAGLLVRLSATSAKQVLREDYTTQYDAMKRANEEGDACIVVHNSHTDKGYKFMGMRAMPVQALRSCMPANHSRVVLLDDNRLHYNTDVWWALDSIRVCKDEITGLYTHCIFVVYGGSKNEWRPDSAAPLFDFAEARVH